MSQKKIFTENWIHGSENVHWISKMSVSGCDQHIPSFHIMYKIGRYIQEDMRWTLDCYNWVV